MLSIMGKNKFWSICTKYAEDEMYRVQNENERTTDTCHKWVVNSASEFRRKAAGQPNTLTLTILSVPSSKHTELPGGI